MSSQPPKRLTALQAAIEALGPNEHSVLLDMIAKGGAVARNGNGCFFDLTSTPPDVLAQIEQFVAFSVDNNRELERHDRMMHDQLKMLQRVPAHAVVVQPTAPQRGGDAPTPRPRLDKARQTPDAPAPCRGARMAFVRRASDAPARRRTAGDQIEVREPPVYLQPSATDTDSRPR